MKEKIIDRKEIRFEYTIKEITYDKKPISKKSVSKKTSRIDFANCTWDKFIQIVRDKKIKDYFKVGDKKQITLKNGEEITIAIAGFDHDVDKDNNKLPVTLTFVDCLSDEYVMNEEDTNNGGWIDSFMRNNTMKMIYETLLPDDLKEIIVESKKDDNTLDKLFIPSEIEVWGKNWYGEDKETNHQYEFYKNKYNRIKFNSNYDECATRWWLRSPYSGFSNSFCAVYSYGYYNNYYASNAYGVAPCFAIA